MTFRIPQEIEDYLAELDAFIEAEIRPLVARGDNLRFFDHRREHAGTDSDNGGRPREEWEALLAEMHAGRMSPATTASPCRRGSAAATGPTSHHGGRGGNTAAQDRGQVVRLLCLDGARPAAYCGRSDRGVRDCATIPFPACQV